MCFKARNISQFILSGKYPVLRNNIKNFAYINQLYIYIFKQAWKPTCEGIRLHSRWSASRQPRQQNRFQPQPQLYQQYNILIELFI